MRPSTGPITHVRNWLRSDMLVLRWVFGGLYVLILIGLIMLAANDSGGSVITLVVAMYASQALFIFGGGTIHLCRPIRKQRLWMPVLAASVMGTVLVGGLLVAMTELFYLDDVFDEPYGPILAIGTLLAGWVTWAVLLWVFVRDRERRTALGRMTAVLISGSLAELLACVPAHIIVSRRPVCLVGLGTMLGIVAGVYVMLFAFGPAVVLLFLRPRYRKEKMESGLPLCAACGYDLRGTLAASRTLCPECGQAITAAQQRSAVSINLG